MPTLPFEVSWALLPVDGFGPETRCAIDIFGPPVIADMVKLVQLLTGVL